MPILSEQQLASILDEVVKDERVAGVLLAGSYAYGTPNDGSDVDLVCVAREGKDFSEFERMRFGVPVNVFCNSPELIRHKYMQTSIEEGHGDCVHFWAHGKIVHDPSGVVHALQEEAKRLWKEGSPSGKDCGFQRKPKTTLCTTRSAAP